MLSKNQCLAQNRLESNHFKAHTCVFIHPGSQCFPTSHCGQGRARPREAICIFQQTKQEEA